MDPYAELKASVHQSLLESLIFGPGDFAASMQMPATGIGEMDAHDAAYPGHRWHAVMHAVVAAARAYGLRAIDAPVAQLIRDLEERGLLDRTLVVIATEFGRDMMTEGKPDQTVKDQVKQPDIMTEPKHYGMHRHFTGASCVLMFGLLIAVNRALASWCFGSISSTRL